LKLKLENIFWILSLCISSYAYSGDFDLLIKPVDLTGELSVEKINKIFADSSGFLWLGTENGLFRWDGIKAIKFTKSEGSEDVTAINQAADGKLWIGFHDGSLAFTQQRQLLKYKPADYFNDSAAVSDILFDTKGKIWWSTFGGGLYCGDQKKVLSLTLTNGLSDNYVYELAFGPDNNVWAATDNGVNICHVDSAFNKIHCKRFAVSLPDLIVLTMVKDDENFMWFGFDQGGVGYFNPKDSTFNKIENNDGEKFGQIATLSLEKTDVWIVDSKNGLYYSKHPHMSNLLPVRFKGDDVNRGIRQVVADRQGNLWILTKKSLFVSNGGTIKVIDYNNVNPENFLHSIIINGYQKYWTCDNNNILKIDQNGVKTYRLNGLNISSTITSSIIDPSGKIWAGTLGQGIIIFDPQDQSCQFVNSQQGLINDNILSIAISDHTVWIATLGGSSAIVLNKDSKITSIRSFNKEDGLSSNFIYCVFPDSKGRVWFGTDGNGIIKLENNIFYSYDEAQGVSDHIVYSIIEDETGNIWFSTSSGILYRFDGHQFMKFQPGSVFAGNTIFSLASNGNLLFILTELGLNIFNQNTKDFVCLNEELGLNQIRSDLNSVDKSTRLISFATHDNIIQVDLDLVGRVALQPKTSIDRITVNLEPYNPNNEHSFSASENRFIFEYSGNWPLAPKKLQYKVKLNGYDPDWKYTFDRSATYPNLLPGNYLFQVKAFLNNSTSQGKMSSFSFLIRKPFYLSFWFIALIVILVLAFGYWFIKAREKKLKQLEARKKEQLEFEFQTLKNQVNPHFLFNSFSTLISIIEEKPEEAVKYTEALSEFFRDILEVKEKELIPLTEELRMIQNYSLIQQKRFGNNFNLNIQLDEKTMASKIPPLTLQLLTENVLKHNIIAKGKPLFVTVSNDQENILFENKKRLKKQTEPSTGIGLRNISERYKLITGKDIRVEEDNDNFKVILPIIK